MPSNLMDKSQIYQTILDAVADVLNTGERPVVIFDLDATLFDVGSRMWHIFREYAEHHDDAELIKALQTIEKPMCRI